ncbi:putative protease inhibitor [Hypoxylon sp. FL1284]|nr:putative protease inhibitor [Hypoxylon sp. FL1284]
MPVPSSTKAALSQIEQDKSKILGMTVGKHANVEPGLYIPKADAQAAPELSFSSLSPDKTYVVLGIDIDAPFPSFSVLGPVLHWIQPGYKATATEDGASFALSAAGVPFVSNYIAPAPPPPSSPHRYVFLLYEQPDGFDNANLTPPGGKDMGVGPRVRFNVDKWLRDSKLGEPVATNYFTSN